ncbi:TIGR01906 family membrane protein [Kocuria tytonis]|uniref:TIGR01906 family membrane protein n=1 Tax=Kocuria tytonis TaxID=2054280 RepID=A0A495A546_9MICC|nr:TIGR01906 family membrane protein [Kocuria tytonis]RKQ34223.1 TIGR01906 family membrane protein [Kocuria tytonis]
MSSSSTAPSRPRRTAVQRVLQVLLALALPVLLLALAVRLVATPAFLWLEYHRPGFPADHWGMGLGERMTFGSYGLDYIMNLAPPEYLAGLVSPEGGLAFTPGEVSHMTDVQHVMLWGLGLAGCLLVLSALAAWYLHRTAPGAAAAAWFAGSWLTVVLLVVAAVAGLLGWERFFAGFHALFFSSGTWTFSVTDTLIRLYPTQFWIDAAVTVALVTLVGAFAVMLLAARRTRRARALRPRT